MHLSLVPKIVSNFILQGLKILKLRIFQTKEVSQLHEDTTYGNWLGLVTKVNLYSINSKYATI